MRNTEHAPTLLNEQDLQALEVQLRRPPRGVRAVERRCPVGHPQVVRVYPLIDGEPFPTLFWLTCGDLIVKLTRLEYQGVIDKLQRRILENPAFRARYHRDHHEYVEERWAELSDRDRRWVEERRLTSALRERGIGGLQDWSSVKCLHMHYAHHLARNNLIGEWLEKEFGVTPGDCSPRRR